jgi:hypothetical protein
MSTSSTPSEASSTSKAIKKICSSPSLPDLIHSFHLPSQSKEDLSLSSKNWQDSSEFPLVNLQLPKPARFNTFSSSSLSIEGRSKSELKELARQF